MPLSLREILPLLRLQEGEQIRVKLLFMGEGVRPWGAPWYTFNVASLTSFAA